MIDILKKLIAFKTTSYEFTEKKRALFWIKNRLNKLPLYFYYFEFSKHPNLLILTQKTKSPVLWLAGHIDVVPGEKDLFKAKIKNERLIGRGAWDMKFAVACYVQLLEDLNKELESYNFGIMLTSDEEIGGFWGTKKILEKGYKGEVVFLPDGGADWSFEIKAKGVWHLKINAYGKSSHGSRPWEGDGAIEKLIEFLREVKKLFKKEPCGVKDHWHSTLTIGKVEGGEATNQVSNFAQAFVDIRFLREQEKEKIWEKLKSLLKQFKGIEMTEIVYGNSYFIDPKNRYIKTFSDIAKNYSIETSFAVSHGSSDARFFVEKNIPVILIKPIGGGHHSDDEWIDLNNLKIYYQVLKDFVKRTTKI